MMEAVTCYFFFVFIGNILVLCLAEDLPSGKVGTLKDIVYIIVHPWIVAPCLGFYLLVRKIFK